MINELDLDKNTIIVLFSDHGTGVGERFGERNYGSFTFEETIRTFYLFAGPKILRDKTESNLLSTIDIFPTILDLCGIKEHPLPEIGKSFADFLHGEINIPHTREFTFSETGALHGPYVSPEVSNVFCIKSEDYKLIFLKASNEWLLFDLKNDPNETKNIYGKEINVEDDLKRKLLSWIDR